MKEVYIGNASHRDGKTKASRKEMQILFLQQVIPKICTCRFQPAQGEVKIESGWPASHVDCVAQSQW